MSRIDVVIPTYNRAEYLQFAIESVLNQSFRDFHLYILDNCSTDNTPEVVKQYDSPNFTYKRNEENLGFIGNLNKALQTGNGEFIQIFHDDDILEPNFLECVVDFLSTNEDTVFVHTGAYIINEENKIVKNQLKNYPEKFQSKEFFEFWLKNGVSIICPSAVFRRNMIVDKIEYNKNTQFTADQVFFIGCSNFGAVGFINKPIFQYREHTGSLTSKLYDLYDLRLKDRYHHTKFLESQIETRNINNSQNYALKYYKKSLSADIWFIRMHGVSRVKVLKLLPKTLKQLPSLIWYFPFYKSILKLVIPLWFIKYYKNNLRK